MAAKVTFPNDRGAPTQDIPVGTGEQIALICKRLMPRSIGTHSHTLHNQCGPDSIALFPASCFPISSEPALPSERHLLRVPRSISTGYISRLQAKHRASSFLFGCRRLDTLCLMLKIDYLLHQEALMPGTGSRSPAAKTTRTTRKRPGRDLLSPHTSTTALSSHHKVREMTERYAQAPHTTRSEHHQISNTNPPRCMQRESSCLQSPLHERKFMCLVLPRPGPRTSTPRVAKVHDPVVSRISSR